MGPPKCPTCGERMTPLFRMEFFCKACEAPKKKIRVSAAANTPSGTIGRLITFNNFVRAQSGIEHPRVGEMWTDSSCGNTFIFDGQNWITT